MGVKRSNIECKNWKIYAKLFVGLVLIWAVGFSRATTNLVDVAVINSLYAALGSPVLPGWVSRDPYGESWQGVHCIASDIIKIVLNGANLGGELGDNLGGFASIRVMNIENNLFSGPIPEKMLQIPSFSMLLLNVRLW